MGVAHRLDDADEVDVERLQPVGPRRREAVVEIGRGEVDDDVDAAEPLDRGRGEGGEVVAFLVSDAASVVTGADWAADGGYSALGPEQTVPAIPQLAQ